MSAATDHTESGTTEDLLTVREAAKRTGYAEKTLRNMMAARVLRLGEHYIQRGPRCRVMLRWSALQRWLAGD